MLRPMRDLLPADLEVVRDRLEQRLGQRLGRLPAARPCVETSVNSSPPMRAMKAPSAAVSSRRAIGAQKLVADDVAEDVVGLLEMVEVDAEDGEARRRAALACSKVSRQRIGERGAVRQIGQRIVMGKMGDLLVPGEQLRARRAACSRAPRRDRARPPCTSSCSTLKLSAISPSSSRELVLTGTMLTEACAASRSPRPSAAMACENSPQRSRGQALRRLADLRRRVGDHARQHQTDADRQQRDGDEDVLQRRHQRACARPTRC